MREKLSNIDIKRLHWRSRRGLLELDLLLQRFFAEKFEQLDEEGLVALQDVLLLPDLMLLDLCQNKTQIADRRFQAIIHLIGATSR